MENKRIKVKSFDEQWISKERFEKLFIDGGLSEDEWDFVLREFNQNIVIHSVYTLIRKEVVRLFGEENKSRRLLQSCVDYESDWE
tara:strand:+ start:57 stop:311 length:255 start_codon:yes stop_codon:yes gene_type:complete